MTFGCLSIGPTSKRFLLAIAAMCLVLGISSESTAQVYMEGSLLPVFQDSNTYYNTYGGAFDTDGEVKPDKSSGFDLRTTLGYVFNGWGLVGLSLNYSNVSQSRGAVDGGQDALTRKISNFEWGPAVGYVGMNWRFVFHYLLDGQMTANDSLVAADGTVRYDAEVKKKLGSAIQLTIGYTMNLGTWFSLGPALIYRQATYTSQSLTNKLDPTANYTDRSFRTNASESDLIPFLSAVARF